MIREINGSVAKGGFPFSAKCRALDYFMQFDWLFEKAIAKSRKQSYFFCRSSAWNKGRESPFLNDAIFCTEWKSALTLLSLGFFDPCKSGGGAFCARGLYLLIHLWILHQTWTVSSLINYIYNYQKKINMTSFLPPDDVIILSREN